MKILFVSQYFPPEMGAPAARVYELSREWAQAGHDVTVLTGFPNHPTGIVPPAYRGTLIRREVVDGIRVVRTPIYVAANRGLLRRSANYVSFCVSACVIGPWLVDRPDVLIATSPQILTGVAGACLASLKRVPFIFDVRDLWPQSIVEVGAMRAGSFAVRLLEAVERRLYRQAEHLVVVTHSFVDEIAKKGIDRHDISVVTNGVDLDLFQPRPVAPARARLGLSSDEFLVTYVGTHGMAHGLETALDAAKLLEGESIRFLFVGEGAEKQQLQERARLSNLTNVTFWKQRPREEIADVLAASDICLVLLRNLPLFRTVIPSKMFEIMGAARPILSTVDGEARRILEDAGAGNFVVGEDPVQLSEAIRGMKRDPVALAAMGTAGREHVEANFSRRVLAQRYLDLLQSLSR